MRQFSVSSAVFEVLKHLITALWPALKHATFLRELTVIVGQRAIGLLPHLLDQVVDRAIGEVAEGLDVRRALPLVDVPRHPLLPAFRQGPQTSEPELRESRLRAQPEDSYPGCLPGRV